MRLRVLALALCGAMVWATAAAAEGNLLRKGPYLQHLASTTVDVRVELKTAALASVEVLADEPAGAKPAPPLVRVVAEHPLAFHSLHVTGLSPATRYRYTVRVGDAAASGTLVTAPPPRSHDPFTFVIYGDDRSDGPAHERVVSAIAKESYDFLVNTGDFVIEGSDEAAWQSFFDIEEPILRDHCLFACVGNHELHNDSAAEHFERYLGPGEGAAIGNTAMPLYGSFRWGRARFFLLNAFDEWARGPARGWLESELTKSDHEDGVDLRVAVMHQGMYAAGPHGGSKSLRAAHIDDLFHAHHIDLVVAGHDHIYERGEADGLKYLVSGGGGAPLYREITALPSTRKVEATYHFVLATVTDRGVSILAKRPDGSTVDTCSFPYGGSWACDAPVPDVAKSAPPAVKASGCGCDAPGSPVDGSWVALVPLLVLAARTRREGDARSRSRATGARS